jgi:hypothetical protein
VNIKGIKSMIIQNCRRPVLPILLLLFSVILVACGTAEASPEEIEAAWAASAHATDNAVHFENQVTERCAKCHTTPGYLEFNGANGDTVGEVTQPVPTDQSVKCDACHSEFTSDKTQAVMPSGRQLTDLGQNANCFECHQGRASIVSVNEAIAAVETGPDEANAELSLPRLHNNPAGPSQHGTEAQGGFEYPGKSYVGFYDHVVEFASCIECHNAHTLQIDPQQCRVCHLGVRSVDDLANIRTSGSDYDGDGDITEGLNGEIETLQGRLLAGIKIYALATEGVGEIDYVDGRFQNRFGETYSSWTPRLLQAAYNYQYSTLNQGGYAHNGKYVIQLLIDSMDDLGFGTLGMTRPE